MRDLDVSVVPTILPKVFDTDGATNGTDVDLAGFDAATVVCEAGTWATDGTYTFSVQHADDDGSGSPDSYADVDADDLDGTLAAVTATTDDNLVQSVGYLGGKRWVRVVMTVAGNTSGTLPASAVVVRGLGRKHT